MIEIRPLKVKDRKLITGLFVRAIKELKDETIENLIRSDAPAAESAEAEERVGEALINVGVELLDKIRTVVDEDLGSWFADLLGKSPEEFDEMPADTELQVIEAIKNRPEAQAFFTRAWLGANVTSALNEALSKGREKLNSILESATDSSTSSSTEK